MTKPKTKAKKEV